MQVEIIHTNETGKWLWAIQMYDTDVWIDAFYTRDDAIRHCEKYGHEIVRIIGEDY